MARERRAEVTEHEEAWGGPLWPAADLIRPMALRVAATLRVADAITAGVSSGPELAASGRKPSGQSRCRDHHRGLVVGVARPQP